MKIARAIASALLLGIIRFYQMTLSWFMGRHCRFHPTCSEYSAQAIKAHGPFRGSLLALRRIGRCHPWSKHSGHDPVPPTPEEKNNAPR